MPLLDLSRSREGPQSDRQGAQEETEGIDEDRLNSVTWKDLSDKLTAISFPDISKILQMESIGTASRSYPSLAGNPRVPFGLQRDLLPELWQNPEMAVDNKNLPIQLEHLCADGEWVSALKQAEEIPLLPSESFVTFVERLTRAIELQDKEEGAQEQVLEEMALTDANEQCKAAILSLPMELAPTLHDMLQIVASDIPPEFTESQNHRIFRLEETFKIIESNPSLIPQLDHDTKCHIQSFLKHI
ncbi:hypothetical protein DUI87_15963 [Hirundo rustica rustica]|uniref:Retroviral nucleocapsid Gag protein p24 C-terminal domain-containing protein n=1 Tax=Hirundo rustica rustica TaxID=333673 RepID=A0A3M0K054_HIRRU|nr:hypothetical protein DUI87_15963 [Hirundo rustica rustica]